MKLWGKISPLENQRNFSGEVRKVRWKQFVEEFVASALDASDTAFVFSGGPEKGER
jgi:hypothetical protein